MYSSFYALGVGRGIATGIKIQLWVYGVAFAFLCPRCRAGYCDSSLYSEHKQYMASQTVSMPSVSGGVLRQGRGRL